MYEGGPNATPTVDAGHLYTLSKHGHLFSFDAASGRALRTARDEAPQRGRQGARHG